MNIGVLAMQGAFREHIAMLRKFPDVTAFTVRRAEELSQCDGLIIPGGESTTIGKLLRDFHLMEPLREKIEEGLPVWGTCAGLILLAKTIDGQDDTYLRTMDIQVKRNAYGRQIDSFSETADIPFLGGAHPLVFIRAPYIQAVGPGVTVLLSLHGHIVAAEEKNMLATSFHPELRDDPAFHQYFINKTAAHLASLGKG